MKSNCSITHYKSSNIQDDVNILKSDTVINTLLDSVSGLLTVLNAKREIVVLNDNFVKLLGFKNPENAVGLRFGEVMQCVNAHKSINGCGTSEACKTCGAHLSLMSVIVHNRTVENDCILSTQKKEENSDVVFKVKAHPFDINEHKYVLMFLQDITINRTRAALENTFFHDFNNILTSLAGATSLLNHIELNNSLKHVIKNSVQQLQKEMEIQKFIFQNDLSSITIQKSDIHLKDIKHQIEDVFATHPRRENKNVQVIYTDEEFTFASDINLINKVLVNMILNALEATDDNGMVTVNLLKKGQNLLVEVHNTHVIPEEIRVRIFQKNFSTKANEGRGLGTFSMKVFGEKVLGGSISFTSDDENGTIFRFLLPV